MRATNDGAASMLTATLRSSLVKGRLPLASSLATRHAARGLVTFPGTMQDFPLTMTHFFDRAERIFYDKTIVTSTVGLDVKRTTYGDWAER